MSPVELKLPVLDILGILLTSNITVINSFERDLNVLGAMAVIWEQAKVTFVIPERSKEFPPKYVTLLGIIKS